MTTPVNRVSRVVLIVRVRLCHRVDLRAHRASGAGVHPQSANAGSDGSSSWIGLDRQMPALVVVEWKFGQPDNEVLVAVPSLGLQPTRRGVDDLATPLGVGLGPAQV